MRSPAGYHYYRTLRCETTRLYDFIRQTHTKYPELKTKELSMLCFCGEYSVEQALRECKDDRF